MGDEDPSNPDGTPVEKLWIFVSQTSYGWCAFTGNGYICGKLICSSTGEYGVQEFSLDEYVQLPSSILQISPWPDCKPSWDSPAWVSLPAMPTLAKSGSQQIFP